jgi:hypothetical protein
VPGIKVEASALGKNFQALLNGGFVVWTPPSVKAVDKAPRVLPEPEIPLQHRAILKENWPASITRFCHVHSGHDRKWWHLRPLIDYLVD